MKYSENYHLYLPEGSDFVSPEQYNDNFEAIDGKLKELETTTASHKHGIGDLTGVAATGHKHAAGDITSGVFAEARIPYIVDWRGLTKTDMAANLNVSVTSGGGTTAGVNFTFPFSAALAARPKRIIAKIGAGTGGNWVQNGVSIANKPEIVILDMCYTGSNLSGTVSGEFRASGQDAATPGEWVTVPLIGGEWANSEIFRYGGDERGYTGWHGFGGGAFMRASIPGATDAAHAYGFYVGNFAYNSTGITCRFTPQGSAAGSTSYTKKLTFFARFYIFE